MTAVKKLAIDEEMRTGFGLTARQLARQATWDNVNNQIAWLLAGAASNPEKAGV